MSPSSSEHPFHAQFSEWLNTNKPLPKAHVGTLNHLLEAQRSELSILDKEIHDLQEALNVRKGQQEKLKVVLDSHRSLLSPIRRLPIEIMQQIFLFCRNTRRLQLLRAQEAPLLLTHVCHDWRSLAYETPLLWGSVHIPIPGRFDGSQLPPPMAFAERWLNMAKQSPLSISIRCNGDRTNGGEGPLECFLRRNILDRAHQIRYLEFDLGLPLLSFVTGALPSASWTALEKVKLKHSDDDEFDLSEPMTPISDLPIWEAPNLRRVEFEGVKSEILNLPINWAKAEELRVHGNMAVGEWDPDWDQFSASQAHALVRDSPYIQNLEVSLNDDGTEFFLDGQLNVATLNWGSPLVLAHLTRLDLVDTYVDPTLNPIAFLHGLQLPALDTLSYILKTKNVGSSTESSMGLLPYGDAHPLLAFLKAQTHPIVLKNFRTPRGTTICQRDFIECLKLMPLLERLWVEDRRLNYKADMSGPDPEQGIAPNATLLRQLQPPPDDPLQLLCPLLRTVKIDRMDDVELEDIEKFVASRLDLAGRYPILPSKPSTSAFKQSTILFPGVARLERLYVGLLQYRPDHVPRRDYGHAPVNLGFLTASDGPAPSCALEENLWEQGVKARIRLWETSWEKRENLTENYEANGGLSSIARYGHYADGWVWSE